MYKQSAIKSEWRKKQMLELHWYSASPNYTSSSHQDSCSRIQQNKSSITPCKLQYCAATYSGCSNSPESFCSSSDSWHICFHVKGMVALAEEIQYVRCKRVSKMECEHYFSLIWSHSFTQDPFLYNISTHYDYITSRDHCLAGQERQDILPYV